jgi:predicted DNA-binding protein (UPF0251 family)
VRNLLRGEDKFEVAYEEYERGVDPALISSRLGITQQNFISNYQIHVGSKMAKAEMDSPPDITSVRGNIFPMPKTQRPKTAKIEIPEKTMNALRKDRQNGMTFAALNKKYGYSEATIWRIIKSGEDRKAVETPAVVTREKQESPKPSPHKQQEKTQAKVATEIPEPDVSYTSDFVIFRLPQGIEIKLPKKWIVSSLLNLKI